MLKFQGILSWSFMVYCVGVLGYTVLEFQGIGTVLEFQGKLRWSSRVFWMSRVYFTAHFVGIPGFPVQLS